MKKTIPKFNCYVNNTGHFFAATFFLIFQCAKKYPVPRNRRLMTKMELPLTK